MRKKKSVFDPVANWDGMISVSIGGRQALWTAEEMAENARNTLAVMERSSIAEREDAVERCPPRRRARMEWWR